MKKGQGSTAPFRVRPAVLADRERLIPLINTAFSIETFLSGPRTDLDRLTEQMQKGTVLLAEDPNNGQVVASVYLEVRGQRGYLGMLAVHPARQKMGLGRRMMMEAEEFLRNEGCVAVDISVLSLRPELRPVYRKMGFIEIGTEEFRYPHPIKEGLDCHVVIMSKWIEDRKFGAE